MPLPHLRPPASRLAAALPLLLAGGPFACEPPAPPPAWDAAPALGFEVVGTFPHDPDAFTQGLLFHDGRLYESTGLRGASTLRRVEPETGRVEASVSLAPDHFGEGLARVGPELIQLTWRAGLAIAYDLETLERTRTLAYEGPGWGLCHDGARLFMSDGSAELVRRDPATFRPLGRLSVTLGGRPLSGLNELECVGAHIYANVYRTDRIVRIDAATGRVNGVADGAALRRRARPPPDDEDAVLNGIAHVEATGVFLLTGKRWPRVLAIRWTDDDPAGPSPGGRAPGRPPP